MPSSGFPPRVRYTPVPNPLFGPLLEQIDDLAELKCTLRVIWLLNQKRGYPRVVTLGELQADRTLGKALPDDGTPVRERIERAVGMAVQRGTLATGTMGRQENREQAYVLNSEPHRKMLESVTQGDVSPSPSRTSTSPENSRERPNVFALYEDNIGILSPMIAEELREAEQLYAAAWLEDAIREAVTQNKRSWRYVARILERWEREGRSDGEPGRYPKQAGHYTAPYGGRSTSAPRR